MQKTTPPPRYSRLNFFTRVTFLGSNGFFCFISICKFDNFKKPFATITSLSELCFRFKRFTLLEKIEKTNEKIDFYELWQQHKQLKTMKISEAWPDFPMQGKAFKKNTSVRRKKEIRKSRNVRITVWGPSKKFNYLSKVVWDGKYITEFTRSISSTRIG